VTLPILASARRDFQEGYLFYEMQEAGLGDDFLASVKADIEGLRISASIHRIAHGDFHRLLCRTFPFGVYYTYAEDTVTVYAVVDCRREPAWIRRHLGS
jgi:hypothetical protein